MSRFVMSTTAAALGLLCIASPGRSALAQDAVEGGTPVLYTVTYVEPPPGWHRLILQAVNNVGDAAGIASPRAEDKWYPVIRFRDGSFQFLSRPEGCAKDEFIRVLRLNDQYQMLVDTSACGIAAEFWGPRSKWTPVAIPDYALTIGGMNDYGDVVGSAQDAGGNRFGFLWKQSSGRYQLFGGDGGYAFSAINDSRQIAGDVIHVPDPDLPWDRSGVTGALFRQNPQPIWTWDANIQSLEEYKDPAHWDYHVDSHAAVINENGTIGFDSPRKFDDARTTGCRWHRKQGLQCAHGIPKDAHVIGIDDADDVFIDQVAPDPMSFVLLPDGRTFELGSVVEPADPKGLDAQGVSEVGYVVGMMRSSRNHDSFILTPTH